MTASELPALGEIRADFTERNTALFLFLGLLSGLGRLRHTLEAEAPRARAQPLHAEGADAQPPHAEGASREPSFHLFVLGLVAVSERVRAVALRGLQDAAPPVPRPAAAPPGGLLR